MKIDKVHTLQLNQYFSSQARIEDIRLMHALTYNTHTCTQHLVHSLTHTTQTQKPFKSSCTYKSKYLCASFESDFQGSLESKILSARSLYSRTQNDTTTLFHTHHTYTYFLLFLQRFWELRDALIQVEQDLIRTGGFEFSLLQPYKLLFNYLKILDGKSISDYILLDCFNR